MVKNEFIRLQKTLLRLCLFLVPAGTALAQDQFSSGIEKMNCGSTTITFDTRCAGNLPGIRFIHVHENEKTAVQAAYQVLAKYGSGCFTTWKALDNRYVTFMLNDTLYKFDPNRIYTDKGRRETLDSNGEYSLQADSLVHDIAETFLANYVRQNKLVIALHNNGDGGGLTINSYKKAGDYAKEAKRVHINKNRDEDDFFLTTKHEIFHFLKKKGFNVLLQHDTATDDGSLSVYAAKNNIPYINVEAQHKHLNEQVEMLDAVREFIKKTTALQN